MYREADFIQSLFFCNPIYALRVELLIVDLSVDTEVRIDPHHGSEFLCFHFLTLIMMFTLKTRIYASLDLNELTNDNQLDDGGKTHVTDWGLYVSTGPFQF